MIAISASGNAAEQLDLVAERLGDLTVPITEILASALSDAALAIETRGSAFGEPFRPWAELTPIVARVVGRESSEILQSSGALLVSLEPGAPGNIFEAGPSEGHAGTAVRHARMQQDGTSTTFHVLQGQGFSPPGIPERPFLKWREERFEEYGQILARHIEGQQVTSGPAEPS